MKRQLGGVDVNDKYMEALAQYNLTTGSVRKGRSGWICETSIGTVLLKEYRGTLKRLEFENQVLGQVNRENLVRVDDYIRTAAGELISLGEDGTRYILKHWFTDPECNLKDCREILEAVKQIARLHKSLCQIPRQEEWNLGSIVLESLEKEMERHNQELKRARNYIRNKKKKTEFERCMTNSYDMFYQQAREAREGMAALGQDGQTVLHLCHGNLDHHHILLGDGYAALIEFNKMHLGIQMTDLYHFMRKVMEKHEWDQKLGEQMLSSYDKVLPLKPRDRQYLYYLFLYPEKYWKQVNFYYNARKTWIPARNMEKIQTLEAQTDARKKFLAILR